jgi:hypothetical protein
MSVNQALTIFIKGFFLKKKQAFISQNSFIVFPSFHHTQQSKMALEVCILMNPLLFLFCFFGLKQTHLLNKASVYMMKIIFVDNKLERLDFGIDFVEMHRDGKEDGKILKNMINL